jgi:hypothetical protein
LAQHKEQLETKTDVEVLQEIEAEERKKREAVARARKLE